MAETTLTDAWRDWAMADGKRRGHDQLAPLMEGLSRSTAVLRAADWNPDPSAVPDGSEESTGE